MHRSFFHITCMFLMLLLVACNSGGGVRKATAGDAGGLPPPDTAVSSGVYQGAKEYRIGAQDLLTISVFGVQELNKEVRVKSNGQVTLPLIGVIMAGGRTIPELEGDLARKYSDGFLQRPQVSVFVKEFTSQRFTFEGAVSKPGIYPITGSLTLIQAIAVAGGLDEKIADLSGIVLIRQVNGQRMAAAYDLRQLRKGVLEDPMIYGGDLITVEQSASKTAMRRFIETLPLLGVFSLLQ